MRLFDVMSPPEVLTEIQRATAESGFGMASEPLTGTLLRTLAASKPAGRFLEIGTGTGIGTAWLLDGMDAASTLVTIDNAAAPSAIAQRFLGHDSRVRFLVQDAEAWIKQQGGDQFDLIFADSFPGKFYALDEALHMLKVGGLYVIDDLLPQSNWPEGHQTNVDRLITTLSNRDSLRLTKLAWASGIILATKITQ